MGALHFQSVIPYKAETRSIGELVSAELQIFVCVRLNKTQ